MIRPAGGQGAGSTPSAGGAGAGSAAPARDPGARCLSPVQESGACSTPLAGDRGSSLTLVLLCFLIAAMLVAAVTTTSSAFLAQRDLQSDCDGAALAAASGVDLARLYQAGVTTQDTLPLAAEQAELAVQDYQDTGFAGPDAFAARVEVELERVTVACERVVAGPFGRLFGVGDGLVRSTVSTARTRLRS